MSRLRLNDNKTEDLLDELVEEACRAVNHPGCLRLFSLRASNGERVVHVTFFVEYGLKKKHVALKHQHISCTDAKHTADTLSDVLTVSLA